MLRFLIGELKLKGIRIEFAAFAGFVRAHLHGDFSAPVIGWKRIAGTGAGATIATAWTSHMVLSPYRDERLCVPFIRHANFSNPDEPSPQCSC
jgi:hypothetical protein